MNYIESGLITSSNDHMHDMKVVDRNIQKLLGMTWREIITLII